MVNVLGVISKRRRAAAVQRAFLSRDRTPQILEPHTCNPVEIRK
jgi:hypothetical protein